VTGHVTAVFSEQVEKQAGVFSRRQALDGGHAASAIDARVRRGNWQVIYPGVYAAAATQLNDQARLWAVVLYAGRGALLSHQTAAWLHGFCGRPADVIHVTIPVERRVRERDGVHVHRSARVIAAVTRAEEPPRVQVEETVLDLVNESAFAADAGAWAIRAIEAGVTDGDRLLATAGTWKKLRWRTELGAALSR
jgi:hypothetical protein